ncbi:T3SS effector cysteine hydrolase SpvD family protein [Pseudomonas fragi]|uniref:T3SS effector cysteine hydrolase SpvD family protein n=1 Tax=Pseudomonas fragi TaxID=296 RepID=UPI0020CDE6B1|nr:T3SS effector cysteine hydrolase SpvD family protein [Pseudomonas fragi]
MLSLIEADTYMIIFCSIVQGGYPNRLSGFVERTVEDNDAHDVKRIKQALHIEPRAQALPKQLNLSDLKQITDFVNCTTLHYSANCSLLAACVHYNIEKGAMLLCAENTTSPLVGMDSDVVEQVIFGKVLNASHNLYSLDEVSHEVLRRYDVDGSKSCIVGAQNYRVPLIGESGHDFNAAVLLDANNKPYVQFVDAWKTSNTPPDRTSFERHFPSGAIFIVRT